MPMSTTFAPLPAADPAFRRPNTVAGHIDMAGADAVGTPDSELPTYIDTGSASCAAAARSDEDAAGCLPPGTRLRQFVIERVLGEGGFGVVYSAYDLALGRRVAIKEYMPAAFAVRRPNFSVQVRSSSEKQAAFAIGLKSFVNEARLLAQLDYPALAKVFQFWNEHGTAYFVMPYYTSPTLAHWLRDRQGAPVEQAWLQKYFLAALDALSFLHGKSCLHRDLSPQNLLVVNDADPLLLDFGAARRVIGAHTASLTAILKPGYAPLEQYDGNTLKQGPWTDLYALAAVMYHAMVGKPPPSATERVVQASGRSNAPGTATSIQAALAQTHYSRPFIAAVELALALHPRHRPQSAEELASLIRTPTAPTVFANALTARPPTLAAPGSRAATLTRARIPTLTVPLPIAKAPAVAERLPVAAYSHNTRRAGLLMLAAAGLVAASAFGLAVWPRSPPVAAPAVDAAAAPMRTHTNDAPSKSIGSAMNEPVGVRSDTVNALSTPAALTDTSPTFSGAQVDARLDAFEGAAATVKPDATATGPASAKFALADNKSAPSPGASKSKPESPKASKPAPKALAATGAASPSATPLSLPPLLTAYVPAAEAAPRAQPNAPTDAGTQVSPAQPVRDLLRALDQPTPQFPAEALRSGIQQARVVASFVVNPDGSVTGIQISTAAPARVFDRAVRSALAQWRFAPVAVATPASVEFAFDVSR